MTDTKLKTTEEVAYELAEQGFTIIPLGSPFEKITEFYLQERCKGDEEKAQKGWPKNPLISWRQYQDKEPTDEAHQEKADSESNETE